MLGRGPLGAPPTLPNFDARNRAIGPISMRGYTGSDMLDGGREWLIGIVDGVDGVDRVPYRLRPGPKGGLVECVWP